MSLEEKTTIDRIEITADDFVQVRMEVLILKDGKDFAKKYHRFCLAPGDDCSMHDEKIQAICKAVWTDEVIKAYMDESKAKLG